MSETSVKIIKNEEGYRDDTVPKTVEMKKALKCKPSALICGRGCAKELLYVRDDLRKRTR